MSPQAALVDPKKVKTSKKIEINDELFDFNR